MGPSDELPGNYHQTPQLYFYCTGQFQPSISRSSKQLFVFFSKNHSMCYLPNTKLETESGTFSRQRVLSRVNKRDNGYGSYGDLANGSSDGI